MSQGEGIKIDVIFIHMSFTRKMTQKTMDDFFNHNKKTCKDIFYINWNDISPQGHWLTEKPPISFETTIKWRDVGYNITLCCTDNTCDDFVSPYEHYYTNVALIKSQLQKCVRRQMTDIALKTAWHFIKMDADAFLRRLFVIMLEDVTIHPSLSAIVWLTSAVSKGYSLKKYQVAWLLGIVKDLCDCNDKFNTTLCPLNHNIRGLMKKVTSSTTLNDPQKDIIMSILFRYGYGGLKGDLNMFYNYATILSDGKYVTSAKEFTPIDPTTLIPLKLSEILVNSADFHCFPQIIQFIREKYPQLTEDEIKKTIWEHNSKFNTREHETILMTPIWSIIEGDLRLIQSKLINSHH